MANAKTKAVEPEVEPTTKRDPLHEYVKIMIPRSRTDEEDVEVFVNNHKWTIKRGVPVEVPVAVAEVLEHKQQMLDIAYDFENKASERSSGSI